MTTQLPIDENRIEFKGDYFIKEEEVERAIKKAVSEERERVKDYLYEKSHGAFDEYGEECGRIVHWCYVKEALTTPLQDKK